MASSAGPSPRERTREDIYQLIRRAQGITRSALVEQTGLSGSTVGHAVGRLLAEGRITEANAEIKGPGSGSGRPAAVLKAVAGAAKVGAIDLGHQHFRVALGDELGHPIEERVVRIAVDEAPMVALAAACDRLEELRLAHDIDALAGVGVGVPGPINEVSGLVCSTTILNNWAGTTPAKAVADRLGVPAIADNDANVGAFGELRLGAGQAHRDFLYIKASHGIGAGLVVRGEPYRGGSGFAGEIGHTIIPGRPELCRCGNRGCLEAVVSVPSVIEQITHTHPQLAGTKVVLSRLTDPISHRILNEAGRTLGRVLADLCNLINPTAVIIGGELGVSGQALLDGVRSSLVRFAQPAVSEAAEVVAAQLGTRAEIHGSLLLAGTLARN